MTTTQTPATQPTVNPPATNGLATASMILGICSIVLCFAGIGTLAMVVLAITFGAVGLRKATHGAPNKGMAIAGLSCGLVGAVVYLILGIASKGVFLLI
jgi:hypothetical protein